MGLRNDGRMGGRMERRMAIGRMDRRMDRRMAIRRMDRRMAIGPK